MKISTLVCAGFLLATAGAAHAQGQAVAKITLQSDITEISKITQDLKSNTDAFAANPSKKSLDDLNVFKLRILARMKEIIGDFTELKPKIPIADYHDWEVALKKQTDVFETEMQVSDYIVAHASATDNSQDAGQLRAKRLAELQAQKAAREAEQAKQPPPQQIYIHVQGN